MQDAVGSIGKDRQSHLYKVCPQELISVTRLTAHQRRLVMPNRIDTDERD